jgi:hypothetical protein
MDGSEPVRCQRLNQRVGRGAYSTQIASGSRDRRMRTNNFYISMTHV